jgi:hypothetical protein
MRIKILLLAASLVWTLMGYSGTAGDEPEKEVKAETPDPAKLLPIGTVVKFSEMDMIYSCNQAQVSTNKAYEYIGVPYPEGNISPDYNVFCHRIMIEEGLHTGYVTEEDNKIREKADQGGNTY